MNEQIKALINEWLETLDDELYYWDGVNASDKEMVEKYIKGMVAGGQGESFFQWLDNRPVDSQLKKQTEAL